jgi:hypothetical protein
LNRTVLWLFLAVALVFAAGFGSGTIAARRAASASGNTYLEELSLRYHLADGQVTQVKSLLASERERIDAILSTVESQVKDRILEARKETQVRIRELLTQEQQAEFDRDRVQ